MCQRLAAGNTHPTHQLGGQTHLHREMIVGSFGGREGREVGEWGGGGEWGGSGWEWGRE